MTDRQLSKADAERLAAFLRGLRDDWYEPEIVTALGNAAKRTDRPDAYQIGCAAVRYAANPTNGTPAGLAKDGLHWRPWSDGDQLEPRRTPTPANRRDMICRRCGHIAFEPNHGEHCGRRADPATVTAARDRIRQEAEQ